ncbi:hypothetical protein B296_00051940, partial [Ensete ventricosum]
NALALFPHPHYATRRLRLPLSVDSHATKGRPVPLLLLVVALVVGRNPLWAGCWGCPLQAGRWRQPLAGAALQLVAPMGWPQPIVPCEGGLVVADRPYNGPGRGQLPL